MRRVAAITPQQMKLVLRANQAHLGTRELDGLLDDSLGETMRSNGALHLAACPSCATELSLLREFRSVMPRPEEAEAVRLITRRLRRRVSRLLADGKLIKPAKPKFRVAGADGAEDPLNFN